jgi:hypothetical protein
MKAGAGAGDSLESRLLAGLSGTDTTTNCWNWQRATDRKGYGMIKVRSIQAAHLWLGMEINSDIHVCHRCDNTLCCNPQHLFLGTQKENIQDMVAKGRGRKFVKITHCKRGHEFTPKNTYIDKRGMRVCRQCMRLADDRYRAKRGLRATRRGQRGNPHGPRDEKGRFRKILT